MRCAVLSLTLVCAAAVLLAQHAAAFSFSWSRDSRQDAVAPVDETCVAHAHSASCQFYVCFDARHPCEAPHNYALEHGWRHCSRLDSHAAQLTPEGVRWLNGSRRCALERLLDHYRADDVTCRALRDVMKDAQAACEVENGLCSGQMLLDNRAVLTEVFALNRRTVSHLFHAVKHCSLSKLRQVATWFRDTLHHADVTALLRDVIGQARQLRDDVTDQAQQWRDDVRARVNRLRAVFSGRVEAARDRGRVEAAREGGRVVLEDD